MGATIDQIIVALGGGPIAALFALACAVIAYLFKALQDSQNARISDASRFGDMMASQGVQNEKMVNAVATLTDEIREVRRNGSVR